MATATVVIVVSAQNKVFVVAPQNKTFEVPTRKV